MTANRVAGKRCGWLPRKCSGRSGAAINVNNERGAGRPGLHRICLLAAISAGIKRPSNAQTRIGAATAPYAEHRNHASHQLRTESQLRSERRRDPGQPRPTQAAIGDTPTPIPRATLDRWFDFRTHSGKVGTGSRSTQHVEADAARPIPERRSFDVLSTRSKPRPPTRLPTTTDAGARAYAIPLASPSS